MELRLYHEIPGTKKPRRVTTEAFSPYNQKETTERRATFADQGAVYGPYGTLVN